MTFAKLKTLAGAPVWINECGVVLREHHQISGDYKGEATWVVPAGSNGFIVRGAPEEIAQVIDHGGAAQRDRDWLRLDQYERGAFKGDQ
jgi:hypothetical protein